MPGGPPPWHYSVRVAQSDRRRAADEMRSNIRAASERSYAARKDPGNGRPPDTAIPFRVNGTASRGVRYARVPPPESGRELHLLKGRSELPEFFPGNLAATDDTGDLPIDASRQDQTDPHGI